MLSNNWWMLGFFILICLAVELAGSWFTGASVNSWFPTFEASAWTPPSWTLGPLWMALLLFVACAIWLVWKEQNREKKFSNKPYVGFGAILLLNLLWTFFFFYLKAPFVSVLIIALLWWAIILTFVSFWNYSRGASFLLVPLFLWVTYAASLNLGIWITHSFLRSTGATTT